MFGDIGGTLAGWGLLIAAVLVAWITGNIKGNASEKVKAAEQRTVDNEAIAAETVSKNQSAIAEQNKAVVEANEIDETVSSMSDADVLNELRNGGRISEDHTNGSKK